MGVLWAQLDCLPVCLEAVVQCLVPQATQVETELHSHTESGTAWATSGFTSEEKERSKGKEIKKCPGANTAMEGIELSYIFSKNSKMIQPLWKVVW
jgi:hypothetical protein